jgi:hypothetical protein
MASNKEILLQYCFSTLLRSTVSGESNGPGRAETEWDISAFACAVDANITEENIVTIKKNTENLLVANEDAGLSKFREN